MAITKPPPAGPRNLAEMFHYVWQQIKRLDLRIDAGGGGGGEANTSSNAGAGAGLALAKVGVDLPFKTLVAGTNINLGIGANTITIINAATQGISALEVLDSAGVSTDVGSA